jgi:hypothetical protein
MSVDHDLNEYKTLDQLLADLELAHWSPIITEWLTRFAGWRAAYLDDTSVEPDFQPLAEVIETLAWKHAALRGDDIEMATRLSKLSCYRWRASGWGQRIESWHPMVESFRAFEQRGPTYTSMIDRPFQPPAVIATWLLGTLWASEHPRRGRRNPG